MLFSVADSINALPWVKNRLERYSRNAIGTSLDFRVDDTISLIEIKVVAFVGLPASFTPRATYGLELTTLIPSEHGRLKALVVGE